MWARKIGEDHGWIDFLITPHGAKFHHKDKQRRVIRLGLDSEGAPMTAQCSCEANSEFIPGTREFKRPRLCSHVWRALKAYKALLERRLARAA
jgi:hypothetical protein